MNCDGCSKEIPANTEYWSILCNLETCEYSTITVEECHTIRTLCRECAPTPAEVSAAVYKLMKPLEEFRGPDTKIRG